ncbi:unnamed protein product [marine sediment metagenome]|uniref:Uncharacterized protein n=1 Tax=marine sediment metagenome TaxID=412755 RepID=X1GSW4_9ZZZZ
MTTHQATQQGDVPTDPVLYRLYLMGGFNADEQASIVETARGLWNCSALDLGRWIVGCRLKHVSIEQLAEISKRLGHLLDNSPGI